MRNISALIEFAKRESARSYLGRASRGNIEHFPQMCGYSFDLVSNSINIDGRFDDVVLRWVTDTLAKDLPPGAILDVGANIGNHTVAFAKTGRKVFAFEPHPRTFRLLELNTEELPEVYRFQAGASDKSQTLRAVTPKSNFGASAISSNAAENGEMVWHFPLVRLDDVSELKDETIALMKIDVEGHERQALLGAEALILSNRPVILLEQNASEIVNETTQCLELLKGWGYKSFYTVDPQTRWRTSDRLPRPLRRLVRFFEALTIGIPVQEARPSLLGKLAHRDYATILVMPN